MGQQDADLLEQFPYSGDMLGGQPRRTAREFVIAGMNLTAGKGDKSAQEAQGDGSADDEDLRRLGLTGQQNTGGLWNAAHGIFNPKCFG
jgi:hypothetical protein